MADLVHTIFGKVSKFEIYRNKKFLGWEFYVYRDGKYWAGTFSSLREAVNYTENKIAKG
jgi:hypothetical protein